jgi:AcrR family transcriptional regulator
LAVKPRTGRHTAEERREEILEAARYEFAARGLHGTSTEDIARRAGISQPYVFRLFGTKKDLFLASCEGCMRETLEAMRNAAVGKQGKEALDAMGQAYMELLEDDPRRLMLQMHMYAASADEDVRQVARRGYGELVEFVERASGEPPEAITRFFAYGMLINVLASMGLDKTSTGWAQRVLAGCPGGTS